MSLSASCQQILYSSNLKGNYQVFSYDLKKKEITQITQNLKNTYFVNSYVLNDKAIIYQKYNTKDKGNLFLYLLETKVEKRLTKSGNSITKFIKKICEDKILYQINNILYVNELKNGFYVEEYKLNSDYVFLDYNPNYQGWILLDKKNKNIVLMKDSKLSVLAGNVNISNKRLVGYTKLVGYFESKRTEKDNYILFEKNFLNNKKRKLFISEVPVKHMDIGNHKILITYEKEKYKEIILLDSKDRRKIFTFTENDANAVRNLYFDRHNDFLILGIDTNNSQLQFYIINHKSEYKLYLSQISNFRGVNPQKIKIVQNWESSLFGNIYYPQNKINGAIIYLHGGPTTHVSATYKGILQTIISCGWIILELDYHGSSSYGKDFEKSINKKIGILEISDCIDAANYLKKLPVLKNKHIGIGGDSYGGFLTLLTLEKVSELFSFGFEISGVSDWINFLNNLPISLHSKKKYIYQKLGDPREDFSHLYSISPINEAYKIKAPVLIIHGKKDERVPVSQSINMYRKLKSLNKNVQLEVLKNADHTLSTVPVQEKIFEKLSCFLSKYSFKE